MRAGRNLRSGVGFNGGQYFFVVEKYFEDFKIAFSAHGNIVV